MPKKFRGQEAVLSLSGGSLPTDPIGVLQEVVVTPAHNVEELRGAGSTKWVDLQKTEVAMELSATVMSWDLDTWDRAVDYDDAAGELDPGAEVPTFQATVTHTAADDSSKEIVLDPGYFDPPPEIGGSREEWIGLDISMRFNDISSITNSDTTV